MITAHWTTRVDGPVEQVFDYVADLKNEPQCLEQLLAPMIKRQIESARPESLRDALPA